MITLKMTGKLLTWRFGNKKIYFYIIYWTVYLVFFSVQRFFAGNFILSANGIMEVENLNALRTSFLTNLVYLPEVIITTHFLVNFILPRFYFRNRFLLFYLLLAGFIFLYPTIPFLVRTFVVEPFIHPYPEGYSFYNYFAAMLIFVFGMAPLAWVEIAGHLREDEVFHQKLDNDRLKALLKLKETELKLLRSQLHPHFLFNTLNNLYSLALEKSDRTPDLIIRLGDMLSYIIYDCNTDKVPLQKEIDFIKSFIELQRVRYESCDISLAVNGEINSYKIAPMLLHTFIDNSFKHGAEKVTGNPWIRISISVNNGQLIFSVINSIREGHVENEKSTGIGIENAKKRLDHIYKERYEMAIDRSDNRYSVFLKLQL